MMVKAIMMVRVMMASGLIIMYDQSSEGYDGQGKIMLNVRGWLQPSRKASNEKGHEASKSRVITKMRKPWGSQP